MRACFRLQPWQVKYSQEVSPCSRILSNGQVDCTIGGLSGKEANNTASICLSRHLHNKFYTASIWEDEYREAAQMWEDEGCNRSVVAIIFAIGVVGFIALGVVYVTLARAGCFGGGKKTWAEKIDMNTRRTQYY